MNRVWGFAHQPRTTLYTPDPKPWTLPPRQPEAARGDDVALDLAAASLDRVRHGAQVLIQPGALGRRPRRAEAELAAQTEQLQPGAGGALIQLRAEQLHHRGLVVRHQVRLLHRDH